MSPQDVQNMQQVAFLQSQTACALIEAEGMKAENAHWAYLEQGPAYREADFKALVEKWGIHHNAALTTLRP